MLFNMFKVKQLHSRASDNTKALAKCHTFYTDSNIVRTNAS